jgi:hypothetical protein
VGFFSGGLLALHKNVVIEPPEGLRRWKLQPWRPSIWKWALIGGLIVPLTSATGFWLGYKPGSLDAGTSAMAIGIFAGLFIHVGIFVTAETLYHR